MYKKVLIFGDTGMLGSVLLSFSKNLGYQTYGCSRTSDDIKIDVTDHLKVRYLLDKINPDLIINTVGIADLDYCEKNPLEAWKVNSYSVYNMSSWVRKNIKKKFIFVSTDQFFSYSKKKKNSENDPISLINTYGKTKFLGEFFLREVSNHFILRTNIIGPIGKNSFAKWVISSLENNKCINLFDDYKVCSIDVYNFSKILFEAIDNNLKGTFNLASRDVFSKKDIIYEFSRQMKKKLVNPKVQKSKFSVPRSLNCGLDVKKIENSLKIKMPTLSSVVSSVLSNYNN